MLYLLVALGIGLVISSVTRNQFLASQVALLASFMPALMLSGFLFDLRNVPTAVRVVGQVLPATYFMDLIQHAVPRRRRVAADLQELRHPGRLCGAAAGRGAPRHAQEAGLRATA